MVKRRRRLSHGKSTCEVFVTCNSIDGAGDTIDENGEGYGAFEDLESGEKYGPNGEVYSDNNEEEDQEVTNDRTDKVATEGMTDSQIREYTIQKKMAKKNAFGNTYDDVKKGKMIKTQLTMTRPNQTNRIPSPRKGITSTPQPIRVRGRG